MKKKTDSQSVIHHHDQFFHDMMIDKRVARDFVESHLPSDILAKIDLDHLELQPTILSDETRHGGAADVIFRTRIDGREGFIFILAEHQSTPDRLMPFRIVYYSSMIIARYLREYKSATGKKSRTIPMVVPIVFYNGRRRWEYSRDIRDIVDAPRELVDRYFLQPFQLVDLTQMEDEELRKHAWSGLSELVMKHIFESDILPYIKSLAGLFKELDKAGCREHVQIVIQYAFSKGEVSDEREFFEFVRTKVSPEVEESVMSLAKKIKEEGIREGVIQTALSMLSEGIDPKVIEKCTKMTLVEISELANKPPKNDKIH